MREERDASTRPRPPQGSERGWLRGNCYRGTRGQRRDVRQSCRRISSAAKGQYEPAPKVGQLSSTNEGRPSHTSIATSANSTVRGSWRHVQGQFHRFRLQTKRPTGMFACERPCHRSTACWAPVAFVITEEKISSFTRNVA